MIILFVPFSFWRGHLDGCVALRKHISRVLTERNIDKKRFRCFSSSKITPGGSQKWTRGYVYWRSFVGYTRELPPLCWRRNFDPPSALELYIVPNMVLVHHTNRTDAWGASGGSITREEDKKVEKG